MPDSAVTTIGSDATMSIWSPSTDQLWEFWRMKKRGDGWAACWGGRIDKVSQNAGYFTPPFGVSASGLTMIGTTITLDEARSGEINHAIGLGLIAPADSSRVRYPAQRSDGTDQSPDALPEGTRLRLDPSVDVESLGLTPLSTSIAKAAQTYGFIVVDLSGAVAVGTEDGRTEKQRTGKDPWPEILGNVPAYEQLKGFPWDKLQVVEADYGKPS